MYNLFISHSWKYPEEYEDLCSLLDNVPYFVYKDYSVPITDPLIIRNQRYYRSELENKLTNQIRPASVVLILAGVYASYSDTINLEIEIARNLGKPIIAIAPWGAERLSLVVKNSADSIVGWNGPHIVDEIRRLSR